MLLGAEGLVDFERFPRPSGLTVRECLIIEVRRWGIPPHTLAMGAGITIPSVRKYLHRKPNNPGAWHPHSGWLLRLESALTRRCRQEARRYLARFDKEFAAWDAARQRREKGDAEG